MHASFLALFALLTVVSAAPTGRSSSLQLRGSPAAAAVSQDTITSKLTRPAQHARVAYCSAKSVLSLQCGDPCSALNGVKVLTAAGDDGEIPGFYIATDPSIQSVVVAHQGTDPTKLLSIANDVEIKHVTMNATLFPSAASGVEVHDGFHSTQGRTADLVLSTVKSALASTGFNKVLTTGHSLGAAVATLDATMLRMQLPSNIEIDSVVFGLPRVGNQQFAGMFDKLVPGFTHVTNQNDPVPIVPPRALEYQQPSGEIHIQSVDQSSGAATMVSCPGQENDNCSEGNSLLHVSVSNHLGPYFNGISFGGDACPE